MAAAVGTAPPRRVVAPDVVTALTGYVVVLVAIPSRLVFAPLGGAGTPAQVAGMLLAAWWLVVVVASRLPRPRPSWPLFAALLAFGATLLASYVAASLRPISAEELRSADLGLVGYVGWFGVMVAAMHGVPTRARLDVLLRRLVVAGGALASLGVAQFLTGMAFTNYIQVPGLSQSSALVSVYGRDGLTRPAGTALHPIEFGAVLTMILPLALHYALHHTDRSLLRRWYPVAAIATAIPISISRSAIVSTAFVLCVVLPTFARPLRRRAYVTLVGLAGVFYVLVPGLLGTVTGLFTGISNDSSALSRTGSYAVAEHFIASSPLFGRGFRTFLPAYRILDNQYLGALVEIGIVGTAVLVGLYATGVTCAVRLRRRSADPVERSLCQALAASIGSAAVSFALFDAFSFPMSASLVFLLLGCIGAVLTTSSRPDGASARPSG